MCRVEHFIILKSYLLTTIYDIFIIIIIIIIISILFAALGGVFLFAQIEINSHTYIQAIAAKCAFYLVLQLYCNINCIV